MREGIFLNRKWQLLLLRFRTGSTAVWQLDCTPVTFSPSGIMHLYQITDIEVLLALQGLVLADLYICFICFCAYWYPIFIYYNWTYKKIFQTFIQIWIKDKSCHRYYLCDECIHTVHDIIYSEILWMKTLALKSKIKKTILQLIFKSTLHLWSSDYSS